MRRAFTLLEVLIVVSIIAAVMAIISPLVYRMVAGTKVDTALNTVSAAATAIRVYATQPKPDLDPNPVGANYSGTALLFARMGDIRLVENNQIATGTGSLMGIYTDLETAGLNGYRDIPKREAIHIPAGAGVVGIAAPGILVSPPFAMRLDKYGNIQAGDPNDVRTALYYDGNEDGSINTDSGRPAGYNPHAPVADVPFERIECVIGVIVFDMSELRSRGLDISCGPGVAINEPARAWLMKTNDAGDLVNAKLAMFSRYSGAVVKH